jgi:putative ABC transport system permease protein
MNSKDLIKMSFNDIKNKKLRSFLTILSISIGTLLVIIMAGIGNGLTNKIDTELKEVLGSSNLIAVMPYEITDHNLKVIVDIGNESTDVSKPKEKKINEEVLTKLKGISGVKDIAAVVNSKAASSKIGDKEGKSADIIGFNPSYAVFNNEEKEALSKIKEKNRYNKATSEAIIAGSEFKWASKNEVIVGQKYLDKMDIKDYNSVIGKEIEMKFVLPSMEEGMEPKTASVKGVIVGVLNGDYPQSYGKSILTSSELAAELQSQIFGEGDYLKHQGYSNVTVIAEGVDSVKAITSEISSMGYEFKSAVDMIDQLKNKTKVIDFMLIAAGVIVLFVATFSLVNTMTMSVQEKKKSIGIMRAVGASRSNITVVFLMQSAVMGFLGGVLGSIIGVGIAFSVNLISRSNQIAKGIEQPLKIISLPYWFIAAAVVFTVAMAVFAGTMPSRKAAKLDPVELLACE